MLRESERLAVEVTEAIRCGDISAVRGLLDANPGLATEYIATDGGVAGTLLHVVSGWPGFFPNGPEIARMLIEAGADPDARVTGNRFAEAPLHRVACSDDADLAEALIDGGADIEIPYGSIGTPLDNAVGYGCWSVARLLVSRGARVDALWHAAALGMHGRVLDLLGNPPSPDPPDPSPVAPAPSQEQLTEAFFLACTSGQRRTAEMIVRRVHQARPHEGSLTLAGCDPRRFSFTHPEAAPLDRHAAVLHVQQPGRLGDLPRQRR